MEKSNVEEIEYKLDKLAKRVGELEHEVETSRNIIRLLALIISSQKLKLDSDN